MAFSISSYTDPGVYIVEEVIPQSVSATTVPLTVALIGVGKRDKRATNEALTRGQVLDEALTVSATPGAHDATLANVSNRQSSQTTIEKDGVAVDSLLVSYRPATITGLALTTLDFTTNNLLSLALDGREPVTILIQDGGADANTVSGRLITQTYAAIAAIATITPQEIAAAINLALGHANATALGYGPSYGSVATVIGAGPYQIVLTSPLSTSASDVRLYASYPAARDRTDEVFSATLPAQADSVIRIDNTAYSALSTYTASYTATDTDEDDLSNDDVQSVVRVGIFAGVTTFKENTDYTLGVDLLDWSPDTAAEFTSSISAATHDISTNDGAILALDGKTAVTIDLNAMASPPPGYVNPAVPAAATPAEIANNINAVLANNSNYGPRYGSVASVDTNRLVLTSPTEGLGSYVQIAAPTTLSAVTALFGLAATQLPYTTAGTGSRPSPGTIYFATYEYTRPTADYATAKRFFSPDALYSDIGYPTATNKLAIAGSLVFENGAPSVIVVQVNDLTFPGSPTQPEIQAALTAAASTSAATEIVVLSTDLGVQVDLLNHVVNMSSPTSKNYRRGWFGMARDTAVGDRDTPDTFVYRAVRTLQVPGDSPGRGRLILAAPANVTRSVTLEDASQVDVDLDSTFLAAAIAARMTSFTSPSETLLRKNVTGFKTDNFETYLTAERSLLAQAGVTVVTLDAGRLALLDPITTEAGGGGLINFEEISASTQKDAVTIAVTQNVDSNLVGVVPSDLALFILTIKGFVGGSLRSLIATGAIAPYKNASGVTRDIDMSRDIQVFQDATNPTQYFFRYSYNLRYPAKRFFGTFTVDNPF